MFSWMARGERKTLLNMATPSSVKAYGNLRNPILAKLDVAFCDVQSLSFWLSRGLEDLQSYYTSKIGLKLKQLKRWS